MNRKPSAVRLKQYLSKSKASAKQSYGEAAKQNSVTASLGSRLSCYMLISLYRDSTTLILYYAYMCNVILDPSIRENKNRKNDENSPSAKVLSANSLSAYVTLTFTITTTNCACAI